MKKITIGIVIVVLAVVAILLVSFSKKNKSVENFDNQNTTDTGASPSDEKLTGKEVPGDSEMIKIVNETMVLFAESVKKKDFSDLYNSIAKLWQNQITPEKIETAFKSLLDANVDITGIKGKDPVFSEKPYIDSKGILLVKGYYLIQPYAVNFNLGYLFEYPVWKLINIEVNL